VPAENTVSFCTYNYAACKLDPFMQGTVLTTRLNSAFLASFWAQLITSQPHYTKDHKEKHPRVSRVSAACQPRVSTSSNAKIAHVSYLYAHEDVVFKDSSRKAEY